MNAAVIGVGNMGQHHARNYFESEMANLVAIADLNEKLGKELATRFNCRYYKSYQEMLEKEEIEVVTIAVPTKFHKEVALKCIRKGINILLEKPIAGTVADARAIVKAAKEKKVKFTVGHIERFNPAVRKLKELIEKGKIGEIVSISNTRIGPMPPQIKDANVVIDIGVHDIDLINWFYSKLPTAVLATGGNAINKVQQDYVDVFLKYGNRSGTIHANWITPSKVRTMVINGTKAYVELNFITQELALYETDYTLENDNFGEFVIKFGQLKDKEVVEVDNVEPLRAEIEAFIKAIKTDTKPVMTANEAIEALEVACKIDRLIKK